MDCLFCKIAAKEIPSTIVYEDDELVAFRDIAPKAPTHVLVIPKKHIPTLNDVQESDANLMGKLFLAVQKIVKQEKIDQSGYRLVWNCNQDGGQEVYHIHCHILGGRSMKWPPG